MVKELNGAEFDEAIRSGMAVVDFSAVWCGPCKMMAPVLEDLSETYESSISFYKVDVDQEPELAKRYGIMSIPALLVTKDGEKQTMLIGFRPQEELEEELTKFF